MNLFTFHVRNWDLDLLGHWYGFNSSNWLVFNRLNWVFVVISWGIWRNLLMSKTSSDNSTINWTTLDGSWDGCTGIIVSSLASSCVSVGIGIKALIT